MPGFRGGYVPAGFHDGSITDGIVAFDTEREMWAPMYDRSLRRRRALAALLGVAVCPALFLLQEHVWTADRPTAPVSAACAVTRMSCTALDACRSVQGGSADCSLCALRNTAPTRRGHAIALQLYCCRR